MSDAPKLTDPSLVAFEIALRAARPALARHEQDRLLFACGVAAGKRAAGRWLRVWQAAAAILACAALGIGWLPRGSELAGPSSAPSLAGTSPAPNWVPPGDAIGPVRHRETLVAGMTWEEFLAHEPFRPTRDAVPRGAPDFELSPVLTAGWHDARLFKLP